MRTTTTTLHGFSVDVEDWFHILDCEGAPSPDTWADNEDRVAIGTLKVLDLLDTYRCKATFFVLGWVARRHPELVAEMAARGHEVGSHGDEHALVSGLDRDGFARDLDRSLAAISAAAGVDVHAFRAPGFSIGWDQTWAFEVLASRGITLDSSLFLAARAHGGMALQRTRPFAIELADGRSLLEVPVVPLRVGSLTLPYSGGGYLRLLPIDALDRLFYQAGLRGESAIAYLHPRELDPGQPRMDLPAARRFKYYVGLADVQRKLERLFSRHRFGTLSAVAASSRLDEPLRLAA